VKAALLVTVVASWYLVGLSVTVALVVYPSFDIVDERSWPVFHRHHMARITWAVGAAWAAQALGLVWWFARSPHRLSLSWWLCAAGAAAAVLLTVGGAVRIHERLQETFDPRLGRTLRLLHGLRTACWLLAAVGATAGLASA